MVAEPGYTLLSWDASQIELRVLAIMSQDPQMLEDLKSGDLHMATAIRMFGYTEDKELMKKRRYDAKQCNFAIVYGADEYKLSEMFQCSIEEAQQFMSEHRAAYPVLYAWMEAQVVKAKEDGYTVNLFGRIRPIPELNAGSWRVREKAEREVVNTIIQGTAVDIVKIAMLYLRKLFDPRVRLILQVHDEILWECPDELVEQTVEQADELRFAFPDYPFTFCKGKIYGEMEGVE
jgi:DNA polymerase-1